MDDFVVMKLDPSGSTVWATYFGGDCYDRATAIAQDGNGGVWVTGNSNSNPFPMRWPVEAGPAYSFYKSAVARFDAAGQLDFSSYIDAGGSPAIAAAGGAVYVAGQRSVVGTGLLARVEIPQRAAFEITGAGNAFNPRNGPVSPGEIITINAPEYTPSEEIDFGLNASSPLPRTLVETRVLFDGTPAAILAVGRGVIMCVAPFLLTGKQITSVQVEWRDAVSNAIDLEVMAANPGLLSEDRSGTGRAYAQNDDGTVNSPGNPAQQGSIVTLFITGGGQTDPPGADGAIAEGEARSVNPLHVLVGSVAPLADSVTTLPGFVSGFMQVKVRIPERLYSDPNMPVTVYPVYAPASSQKLAIAVK